MDLARLENFCCHILSHYYCQMISNILEKLTVGMDPLDIQIATLCLPTLPRQHLYDVEGKKEALTQKRG